jgi:hypothetical protein
MTNELKHHGVKGMKWGRRKATDSGTETTKTKKPKMSVKKKVAIGAAIAATALAAYGAYKIHSIKSQNVALGVARANAVFDMYSTIGQRDKGLSEFKTQVQKTRKQSLSTAYKNVKEAHKNLNYNSSYYGDHIIRKFGKIRYKGR